MFGHHAPSAQGYVLSAHSAAVRRMSGTATGTCRVDRMFVDVFCHIRVTRRCANRGVAEHVGKHPVQATCANCLGRTCAATLRRPQTARNLAQTVHDVQACPMIRAVPVPVLCVVGSTWLAMWSGASPFLVLAEMGAPLCTMASATFSWPERAAQCSGVRPSLVLASRLAPLSRRSPTMLDLPHLAATCSGVMLCYRDGGGGGGKRRFFFENTRILKLSCSIPDRTFQNLKKTCITLKKICI